MMSYCVKLSGEDLSRYLNKIGSSRFKIGDLTVNAEKCLHFLALHHGGQNIWHR